MKSRSIREEENEILEHGRMGKLKI